VGDIVFIIQMRLLRGTADDASKSPL